MYSLTPPFIATITTCSVHLINDGITVHGSSIVVEWEGTGALNYKSGTFKYVCRVDNEEPSQCMFYSD